MAYGNNSSNQQRPAAAGGFQKKPAAPAAAAPRTSTPASNVQTADSPKATNKLFAVFKNKGQGYSVVLKEDVTIPAGTRVGIFEDTIKGKDGTDYQVLSVTKLPERTQS